MSQLDSPPEASNADGPLAGRLGLWDAVSIIIGIVVGVSIFKVAPGVVARAPGPWAALGLWLLGGVLSLAGALCYAELATAYPRSGGNYVYLSRAFGAPVGFLYGWAHLVVIQPGNAGMMAYIFADYAVPLLGLAPGTGVWLAAGVVIVLGAINMLGVVMSKSAQNFLTATKVAGLAAIVLVGLVWGNPAQLGEASSPREIDIGLAMILILYAYGGWSDAAFVAAEVRDLRRNMPRALLLGTAGIAGIYLLVNLAYLAGLGYAGASAAAAPAADVLALALGERGSQAMRVIVMISALGGLNGLIFTGSRVYASMGADHRVFARLGRWNRRVDAPLWSLALQTLLAVAAVLAIGTAAGQTAIDALVARTGLEAVRWSDYTDDFETLLSATAPVFWAFFLLAGISLFVLRWRDRERVRPFRVPLFPLVPLVFCLTSGYMLYASIAWAGRLALLPLVPLGCAVPLYVLSNWKGDRP